jgi:hypothetical protein
MNEFSENVEQLMQNLRRLYWQMRDARTNWYASHGQPDSVRHALGQQWDKAEKAWSNEYRRLERGGVQITEEAFA